MQLLGALKQEKSLFFSNFPLYEQLKDSSFEHQKSFIISRPDQTLFKVPFSPDIKERLFS